MTNARYNQRPDDSEGYYHELLEVHALCDEHDLVFAHEMTWACRALRAVCSRIHKTKDDDIERPGKGDERTPAVRMMEHLMSNESPLNSYTPPPADLDRGSQQAAEPTLHRVRDRCVHRKLDPIDEIAALEHAWLLLDQITPPGQSVTRMLISLLVAVPQPAAIASRRPSQDPISFDDIHNDTEGVPPPKARKLAEPAEPMANARRQEGHLMAINRAEAKGKQAAQDGEPRDSCPYKSGHGGYRSAWLRGFDRVAEGIA